jgi:hypothetical protein
MNPDDPASAQRIVAEYAAVLEQHAEREAYPAPVRTLPYPKQTLKAAIFTCAASLRDTGQLTDELRDFLEAAYVLLADYIDDELVRVTAEYRESAAALATDSRNAREKVQTDAWRRVAATSALAGEIAKTIADDAAALREEFDRGVHAERPTKP